MGGETLTCALAHSRTPPIGANIIPTTKKRGNTLFGVRIGLVDVRQQEKKTRFAVRSSRAPTARPSSVVVWKRYLDEKESSYEPRCDIKCVCGDEKGQDIVHTRWSLASFLVAIYWVLLIERFGPVIICPRHGRTWMSSGLLECALVRCLSLYVDSCLKVDDVGFVTRQSAVKRCTDGSCRWVSLTHMCCRCGFMGASVFAPCPCIQCTGYSTFIQMHLLVKRYMKQLCYLLCDFHRVNLL